MQKIMQNATAQMVQSLSPLNLVESRVGGKAPKYVCMSSSLRAADPRTRPQAMHWAAMGCGARVANARAWAGDPPHGMTGCGGVVVVELATSSFAEASCPHTRAVPPRDPDPAAPAPALLGRGVVCSVQTARPCAQVRAATLALPLDGVRATCLEVAGRRTR